MRRIRKYLFAFVILQVVILLLINGLTYARYVSNSVFNYYLKSKSFYFTSDYLGNEVIKNVNNFWNGENTYFNVKNSINQGAVSELDIDYTVTCDTGDLIDNVDCSICDASKLSNCSSSGFNTYNGTLSMFKSCINNTDDGIDVSSFTENECNVGGYTYKNHAMEADLYFNLIPKNGYEISDVTVNVSVTSSPYNKELKGRFLIHKAEIAVGNINSVYENYLDYDRLTITNTYLENKCVNVSFNSNNLRVGEDSTKFSSVTETNDYISGFKINVEAQSNKSYIFYKASAGNYTIDDFVIEESDGC